MMTYKHKSILALLVAALIAQLSIASYFFIYQGDSYASAINIAGKQRMLSQRIALFANGLSTSQSIIRQKEFTSSLNASLQTFKSHHRALISGSKKLRISPSHSKEIEKIYYAFPYNLNDQAHSFIALSETVLKQTEVGLPLDTVSEELLLLTNMAMTSLLQSLDVAVWQYQRDADGEIDTQMQLIYGIFILIIFTLFIGAYEFHSFFRQLKHQNKALRVSKFVFDHSVDGIITTDGDGLILTANDRVKNLIGYTSEAIIGREFPSLLAEISIDDKFIQRALSTTIQTGEWRGEVLQRCNNAKPISVGIRAVYSNDHSDPDSGIISYVIIITDISEQKASEEKFRFLSMYDPLTGLLNRTALYQEFDSRAAVAKRENNRLGILMMDLDGFKQANDLFGHDAGDHVLLTLSERLKKTLRASDVLARFGGDEFIAIIPEGNGNGCPELVAEKIILTVSRPIQWQKHEITVGISIGIANYPDAGDQLDILIKKADTAMYKVKQNGKNNFSTYCNLHKQTISAPSCLSCSHSIQQKQSKENHAKHNLEPTPS